MNTRQEIIDAINGEHEGMAPPAVFTQTAVYEDMQASGASFPEANFEADAMVKLSLQMHERHGFATARVPFCITVEAERLGATLQDGGKNSQPSTVGSPFMSKDIIDCPVPEVPDFMDPQEFLDGGRCAMILEILKRFRIQYPDLFTTVGIVDPMGIAGALTGFENFLMGCFMDPSANQKWVDAVTPFSCVYAQAVSEYADNVMLIASGSEDGAPSECFDDMVCAPDKKVFSSVRGFSMCHSCGRTLSTQSRLAQLGETMLSLETSSDPAGIIRKFHDKVKLVGGIDPLTTLINGTPEEIREKAREYDGMGYDIIIPECGVPPVTRGVNLDALAHYRE